MRLKRFSLLCHRNLKGMVAKRWWWCCGNQKMDLTQRNPLVWTGNKGSTRWPRTSRRLGFSPHWLMRSKQYQNRPLRQLRQIPRIRDQSSFSWAGAWVQARARCWRRSWRRKSTEANTFFLLLIDVRTKRAQDGWYPCGSREGANKTNGGLKCRGYWAEAAKEAVVVEADAFKETDVLFRALSARGHDDIIHTAELVSLSLTLCFSLFCLQFTRMYFRRLPVTIFGLSQSVGSLSLSLP